MFNLTKGLQRPRLSLPLFIIGLNFIMSGFRAPFYIASFDNAEIANFPSFQVKNVEGNKL